MIKRFHKFIQPFLFIFIFLLSISFVYAAITVNPAAHNPTVEYDDAITISTGVSSTFWLRDVIITVDGLDYQMYETQNPDEYAITLHTIGNLAATGIGTYDYTITAINIFGNNATSLGSFNVTIPITEP